MEWFIGQSASVISFGKKSNAFKIEFDRSFSLFSKFAETENPLQTRSTEKILIIQ